jgi:hypothetical protein
MKEFQQMVQAQKNLQRQIQELVALRSTQGQGMYVQYPSTAQQGEGDWPVPPSQPSQGRGYIQPSSSQCNGDEYAQSSQMARKEGRGDAPSPSSMLAAQVSWAEGLMAQGEDYPQLSPLNSPLVAQASQERCETRYSQRPGRQELRREETCIPCEHEGEKAGKGRVLRRIMLDEEIEQLQQMPLRNPAEGTRQPQGRYGEERGQAQTHATWMATPKQRGWEEETQAQPATTTRRGLRRIVLDEDLPSPLATCSPTNTQHQQQAGCCQFTCC